MNDQRLPPEVQARMQSLLEQFERLERDDCRVWLGDAVRRAPLSPRVLTARDIYKRILGVDMPDNVTATWEGSTVTFHAKIDPVEMPFSFCFGESDE